MANEQNLVNLTKRTERERKEIARKGQIASTKAKREKKLLRDTLLTLLEMEDKKGVTGQDNICIALYKKANCGDTKAFEIIRDTIGQRPIERIETTEIPVIKDDV